MSIDYQRLRIGDRIVRTKGGILSKHHVLYVGFWDNQHLIAENQLGFGVRYITLNQFLSEGQIERIEYYNYNEQSQAKIINRINKKIGTKYSLLDYNCEHFVNEILTGIAESKQIKTGIILGIGVTLCLLAFGSKSKK
ncbi:lecithin retinol acyltransferase [Kordia sp. SMS9]|uniref:lecithin retinol acyltransferase family protein n=1 Tax=Kordia sp. SMS9 TaxID=2282170 RepID=UPI000E0E0305|nr:lecithin retinol acyltransferase family protein [Kordia sp. SMS9]AXG71000.1 lecithin retinol acyltransferase [Kordia sp. SMS9]